MAELVEITDPADPRLGDYRDLRDVELRKHLEAEHGLFLAEGEKVVRRAVEAGYHPRSFLMAPRWLDGLADVLDRSDAPCYVLSEDLAEQVTGFHVHRGALASLERRPLPSLDDVLAGARTVLVLEDLVDHTNVGPLSSTSVDRPPERNQPQEAPDHTNEAQSPTTSIDGPSSGSRRIAILEDIVDHANVGAAFRGAAAMGLDAVLITPRCADPLYRRAIKVSMGTVFQVPWTRVEPWPHAIEILQRDGYVVAALTLSEDAITLDELAAMNQQKLALVLGTEGHGIKRSTADRCDYRVKIPMAGGVDSLNVSAAAAIAFYATRPRV